MRWFFCFKKVVFQKLKSKRKRGRLQVLKKLLNKNVDKGLEKRVGLITELLGYLNTNFFINTFPSASLSLFIILSLP